MKVLQLINIIFSLLLTACNSQNDTSNKNISKEETVQASRVIANAVTILSREEIPILCYHQIRNYLPEDSKTAKDYIVPVETFKQQMKMLSDSGYHSISPDQLYEYLAYGTVLPLKPVMITFDDTRLDQFTNALPALNQYKYKGVFFIMTVSLGRPGYMSSEQVKSLFHEGHAIGSHTWNHGNVKTYTEKDWEMQIDKPAMQLEKITGKRIHYFAYPFGLWSDSSIMQLKKRDYRIAFQLSAKRKESDPLYTVRRIIVPGEWSAATLLKRMKTSF